MVSGQELAMRLRRAYLTMHRAANAVFAAHGTTADQFVLLALLADADGITQKDLVDRSSSDANTVRAMLLLLEGRGWVRRDPHPTDGRAWCVRLTPAGRTRHARLVVAAADFHDQLSRVFAPAECADLLVALDRVRAFQFTPPPAQETADVPDTSPSGSADGTRTPRRVRRRTAAKAQGE